MGGSEGLQNNEERGESMSTDEKLDLIIRMMEEKFGQIDEKFGQIDEKFEQIDKRFEQIDKRLDRIENELKELHSMDEAILDEVERVHHILDNHIHDPNAHCA
jgi:archaellum component FlaC